MSPAHSPWRDNAGLYVVSFTASALTNGLPQAFLLRHEPAAGSHVLALILLGGTLANLVGVGVGTRWATSARAATGAVRAGTLALWLLTTSLTALGTLWTFAAAYGAARFCVGVLGMALDSLSVRRAGATHRAHNDRIATLLRVLGMLSGILAVGELPVTWLIAMLGVASLLAASLQADGESAVENRRTAHAETPAPVRSRRADIAVFLAGLFAYAGFYVGAATLAGTLAALGADGAPLTAANRSIALVFAVAAAGVMGLRAPRRGQALWLLPSAAMLFVLAHAITGLAADGIARLGGAAVFGLGFAMLLVVLRDVATRRAESEQVEWLRRLNRLPDVAAAVGFGLLALGRGTLGLDVSAVLIVLGVAAVASIVASAAVDDA